MAKTFFTYEQQLNKLQQEKDLIIPDTDAAKLTLEKLSYYSLIGGYKELFKHTLMKLLPSTTLTKNYGLSL